MEALDLRQEPDNHDTHPAQRGCLAAGCSCKDVRILSRRRAMFHAYVAKTRGETASRIIVPEASWIPPLGV